MTATITEFERKALDYDCPLDQCRRNGGTTGKPCLKLTATNNYWDKHYAKHPHKERVAKAREDTTDQGKADW